MEKASVFEPNAFEDNDALTVLSGVDAEGCVFIMPGVGSGVVIEVGVLKVEEVNETVGSVGSAVAAVANVGADDAPVVGAVTNQHYKLIQQPVSLTGCAY